MNKQQLASKIWESAKKMRSKIEANEYKDYILGFIFYKYLSDNEVRFLVENDFSDDDIKVLTEEDAETVAFVQNGIGYFIAHENLFSTWIEKGKDFGVADVRDALSAFSRLISPTHKKVFDRILDTLHAGLSKLGDSSSSQTKAISDLIQLIKVIPMDNRQDYDVLGFIYEYLIGMFAANAGKKAGEFYTPHEVSLLMSEIVADHVKGRPEIKIYDPTSGSGSLMINIGRSVAKHVENENNIKYYAQEIKENTHNLTRMNLVMRGISPYNIMTRNGDTLEEDWPFFEDSDPIGTYDPLFVDAVVSNPPYSQAWDPANKASDPRFKRFGLAPKSKADFAFLLHDLFHLKPDGIMTIILPHGVLFRGGEEGKIRKNLIEKNHIDTIIGLPPNIFFGTGIPTIIMILKKNRPNTDVLIVDASKGFSKVGKNNVLRASDIRRIADTVTNRASIEKYSRAVDKDEIQRNEYSLNIPRYVDSSEVAETWDVYASMFGGIPVSEISELSQYWNAFEGLESALFEKQNPSYYELEVDDVEEAINTHQSVIEFKSEIARLLDDYERFLIDELIRKMMELNVNREESVLSEVLFEFLDGIPLVDKYKAYQILNDEWAKIAIDLEILQTEGFHAAKIVNPNMVTKKKDGKDQEVQDGYVGHVIPFSLVQDTLLQKEAIALKQKEESLRDIQFSLEEIIASLSEEEKSKSILNDANDAFVSAEVNKELKEIYRHIETEELAILVGYLELLAQKTKKDEKISFIKSHPQVSWSSIEANKDGTYAKGKINAYIKALHNTHAFCGDSFEGKMVQARQLMDEEKSLKAQIKESSKELHLLTKETIEGLTDKQIIELLEKKWIVPLMVALRGIPDYIILNLVSHIDSIAEKYAITYAEVAEQIFEAKASLSILVDNLRGNEYDKKGLAKFQQLLRGE